MNLIACRHSRVGRAVAEVAERLGVPHSACHDCFDRVDCAGNLIQNCDGVLVLVRNPARFDGPEMQAILQSTKPALVVAVRSAGSVETAREWMRRKGVASLFITGDARVGVSRQFMRALLGGASQPRHHRPTFLAKLFHWGWRVESLEFE